MGFLRFGGTFAPKAAGYKSYEFADVGYNPVANQSCFCGLGADSFL